MSHQRNTDRINYRLLARLVGMLLTILATSMVVPIAVSVAFSDGAQYGLFFSALALLMVGLFLRNFVGAGASYEIRERDSVWITAAVWIIVPLIGAMPYLFTSSVSTFTDAVFESFSGFTTTGSSILRNVDAVPPGLLVWRSTSQWIGGMGLILFVIALLHRLNEGSSRLYDAEFSGTLQRRLHPRMSRNVLLMWTIYASLTAVMFILLLAGGNGFVDSYCTALSTVSTGGFMTHMSGMECFSPYSTAVVIVFMFLSGINLALLFHLFTGRVRLVAKDEELKRYVAVFVCATIICAISFISSGNDTGHSLKFSVFHVASTLSTCGFYISSPAKWPFLASAVTLILIFIGASAGSTGGGIKLKRVMIVLRYVRNYFITMIHPHAVVSVKLGDTVVNEEYVKKIFAFIFLYLLFIIGGTFVLTLSGLGIPDALCMAAANIGNLGPSPIQHALGGTIEYWMLIPIAKWAVVLLMLAGRLEIFALAAMFMPEYWKKK